MFKVTTICIGQHITSVFHAHRNGMECEIIGPLECRSGLARHQDGNFPLTAPCYRVRWADGVENLAFPKNLRKKPPKGETNTGEESILDLFKEPAPPVKTTAAGRRVKADIMRIANKEPACPTSK